MVEETMSAYSVYNCYWYFTNLFTVSQFGNCSDGQVGLFGKAVQTFHGLHDFIFILHMMWSDCKIMLQRIGRKKSCLDMQ